MNWAILTWTTHFGTHPHSLTLHKSHSQFGAILPCTDSDFRWQAGGSKPQKRPSGPKSKPSKTRKTRVSRKRNVNIGGFVVSNPFRCAKCSKMTRLFIYLFFSFFWPLSFSLQRWSFFLLAAWSNLSNPSIHIQSRICHPWTSPRSQSCQGAIWTSLQRVQSLHSVWPLCI